MKELEIAFKWKSHHESIKRFYLIDKQNGENKYKERMALLQGYLNCMMNKKNIELIPALIEFCKDDELDGMLQLQFICAAYELSINNDYTI